MCRDRHKAGNTSTSCSSLFAHFFPQLFLAEMLSYLVHSLPRRRDLIKVLKATHCATTNIADKILCLMATSPSTRRQGGSRCDVPLHTFGRTVLHNPISHPSQKAQARCANMLEMKDREGERKTERARKVFISVCVYVCMSAREKWVRN